MGEALRKFESEENIDTSSWIDEQWEQFPKVFQVAKPSPLVPISNQDQKFLQANFSNIARNRYINKTYKVEGLLNF
jgi:hypothetical protein